MGLLDARPPAGSLASVHESSPTPLTDPRVMARTERPLAYIPMNKQLKRLIPQSVLNEVRSMRVGHNRRSLVRAGRRCGQLTVFPDNSAEHYYHFLFDLALPLFLLLRDLDDDVSVTIDATGPFIPRLLQLFPRRVRLGSREDGGPKHKLLGMNPIFVTVRPAEFDEFSMFVRCAAGAFNDKQHKVILIERLPPQEFFRTQARHTGGGSSRRSIPNHTEVQAALEGWVGAPLAFQNVRLEELDFLAQVRLFASAKMVVGQHGAGLANAVWMAPGGTVVEISNRPDLRHFRIISRGMRHRHLTLPTTGPHASVDPAALLTLLNKV